MREELVKKLQTEFPWFPKKNPLFRSDLKVPMFVDTDDGWFPLIHKLCQDLDPIIKKEGFIDFSVDQVKEKFGGLRFYTSYGNEEIFDLIQKAEADSFKICEKCGKKGSGYVNEFGWLKTLCKKCAEAPSDRMWTKLKQELVTT